MSTRAFTFPGNQSASDECPAIPRTVTIYAENRRDAYTKMAQILTEDPELTSDHPEFSAPDSGDDTGSKPKKTSKKKSS